MLKKFIVFLAFIIFIGSLFSNSSIRADAQTEPPHYTLIVNQVRGTECCDVGSAESLYQQIEKLKALEFAATFTIRYDALKNPDFVNQLKELDSIQFEVGGFLEITPSLAQESQVAYDGNETNWYEAQHAFLIGYDQTDRQKLLDTYMAQFKSDFGQYPTTTTAWMIDSWSLQYLAEKYGVKVHQLTREQMGTDSYSLYGGPPHYPYWPSPNWPLIPSAEKNNLPLIIRQTITDPVMNYGDPTNSYTSQPNDYGQRKVTIDYFTKLLKQAHNQPTNNYTFALIGLENSMPAEVQTEFFNQLDIVKDWTKDSFQNQVITANQFHQWLTQQTQPPIQVYAGQFGEEGIEKAWWITTPKYRARVRLSKDQLYISDFRLYDATFSDPYQDTKATSFGWWVAPFLVDGSRYFYHDDSFNFDTLANDTLLDRKPDDLSPTRWLLNSHQTGNMEMSQHGSEVWLTSDNQPVIIFQPNQIFMDVEKPELTNSILASTIQQFSWKSADGQTAWELVETDKKESLTGYQLKIHDQIDLATERTQKYPLLFPELKNTPVDADQSSIYINNRYAIAGQNPVRLVYYPRDKYQYPVQISSYPQLETNPEVESMSSQKQHGRNGMVFLDFYNQEPLATTAKVTQDAFHQELKIYFAPNCKDQVTYCLEHPRQGWWYLRALIGNKWRAWKAANN